MIKTLKINHFIDKNNPTRPSVTGAVCETVRIGEKEYCYYTYIPEGVRASTSGIFIFPEDGCSAEDFLAKSSWCSLADEEDRKEKCILFFLEPPEGKWNLEYPEEDLKYVHQVKVSSTKRDKYCVHEAKNYLVGYGSGGTMAQMVAVNDPCEYAGVVSVNAPDVNENFLNQTGSAPCELLHLYEDTEHIYGYQKKDFTVPAWVIGEEPVEMTAESNIVKYWRNCAVTENTYRQLTPETAEFYRSKEAPWTVNQEKEAFRVWVSSIKEASLMYGKKVNRKIWTAFLRNVRRWSAEPGGDLRMTRDPVVDLKMEYHFEEIDGWMKEWNLYVPTYMRDGYDKPAPLVIACHGYSCSGEIYSGNTDWYRVAEKNGFLVAFPSAVHGYLRSNDPNNPAVGPNDTELPAWNLLNQCTPAPNELIFFKEMIHRIKENHKVDEKRIYATGHSMGSAMTQYLGFAAPEIFAAIAPCSGVLFASFEKGCLDREEVENRKQCKVPVWMFGGENEKWLLDAVPEKTNQTGKSIDIWWVKNDMKGNPPEDYGAYCEPVQGRWHDYVFKENDIPMIRYSWVEEMPHSTMPEMSYRIWNEFFSHIRKNEEGNPELISE